MSLKRMAAAMIDRIAGVASTKPHPTGFDRIARAYRWLEYFSFGCALERCRDAYLPDIDRAARRALLLGDGDGRFTARLLRANPPLQVVAVDSSAAMLALLAARVRRVGASGRLITVHSDALLLLANGCAPPWSRSTAADSGAGFDFIASHFFLDCLSTEEASRLAGELRPHMAPGGQWIVSEFATPAPWARLVVGVLYRCFALLVGLAAQELPLWRQALEAAGWVLAAERSFLRGLLVSTTWQLAGAAPGPNVQGNHATHPPVPPA